VPPELGAAGTQRRVPAARTMSFIERIPLIAPDESTTGRRRTLNCSVRALAVGGRLLTCASGGLAGDALPLSVAPLRDRRALIVFSALGSKGELLDGLRLVRQGKVRPVIYQSLPLRDAARALKITLVEKAVRTESEARAALAGVRKGEVDGILAPRSLSLNIPGFILEFAPRRAIPTMFDDPLWIERGGLASYSANFYRVGQQAARLVDKIIKGAKPADIPVEQPMRFELVINLKTAKALGIAIPPSVLVRTDRLIQ